VSDARSAVRPIAPLTLAALGVVYGDIGTSPLYALRECFFGAHAVEPTQQNVLGVLSLIVYSLIFVISAKYVAIVLRADNQGEGGILAMTALLPESLSKRSGRSLLMLGIFGAALLYGDGMITPAITVLGAVEGLTLVTPALHSYVVPIAVVILVGIFSIQRHGTHRVGRFFGPVMLLWFATLAVLGLLWTLQHPVVLSAFNPRYAVEFFMANGWHGLVVLGGVMLVVTGGEALYADMGHFGARPIRLAWFGLVMPALLLNYFGQGALLLADPTAASQPFFRLVPAWALIPLVALSTMAAIIASQALISGAFSLTRQAVQLGFCPRLEITHTSRHEMGQVYVSYVNWALMLCTIAIVIGFGSSADLAAAYGIAVTMTMAMTTVLLHAVMIGRWQWPKWVAGLVAGSFLLVELAFLLANIPKVIHGGWLPIVIGAVLFTLMTTWKTGRQIVARRILARTEPLADFVARIPVTAPARVPGTAVFMTAQTKGTPPALAHNLRYNRVLHERVVTLMVSTSATPHVPSEERITITPMGQGVWDVAIRYGFMEDPDVPAALAQARDLGLDIDLGDVTYFLGRETLIVTSQAGMAQWREQLFVLMARNAQRAVTFFRLPPERVVELGIQVEL
jgi:KUP system potassium uptake protein